MAIQINLTKTQSTLSTSFILENDDAEISRLALEALPKVPQIVPGISLISFEGSTEVEETIAKIDSKIAELEKMEELPDDQFWAEARWISQDLMELAATLRELDAEAYGKQRLKILAAISALPQAAGQDFWGMVENATDEMIEELVELKKTDLKSYLHRRKEAIDGLATLKAIREAHGKKFMAPIYQPQSAGEVPLHRMTSLESLENAKKVNGIAVEDETQITQIKVTEELLNEAVTEFRSQELFVWENKPNGCYARAAIMRDQLILMGVPAERIKKIYCVYPFGDYWNYHVALVVRLDDGSERVVDPYFDKEACLTIERWTDKQNPEFGTLPPPERIGTDTTLPYKKKEYTTYIAPHNTFLRVEKSAESNSYSLKFETETEEMRKEIMINLGQIRTEKDLLMIDSQIERFSRKKRKEVPKTGERSVREMSALFERPSGN